MDKLSALTSLVVFGAMPLTTLAGDLSKYRDFQLGSQLAAVAKLSGASLAQAKIIHRRPALIQELDWSPQPIGPAGQREPAKDVVFSFYDGELFRIAVNYDRYETEGLTTNDIIEVISTAYGTTAKRTELPKGVEGRYGDQEEIVAQWQDSQYRFDLTRSTYGPSFKLTGVLKRLEAPAQAAMLEAARLDVQEEPQRDAARMATEKEAEKAKLDQARLVNKPRFRP